MADPKRALHFHSDACGEETFHVLSFEGEETISRLFRFTIEMVSEQGDVDLDGLLEKPARLEIRQLIHLSDGTRGSRALKIHGVLSSVDQIGKVPPWVQYRVTLVPKLWRASLAMQSQIYMEKTNPQIIEEELKKAGLTGSEYEVSCPGTHPQREYVVQYQESDLNFIQRLAEHEGISYYFKHEDAAAKAVFCDSMSGFAPIQGTATIPFHPIQSGQAGYMGRDALLPESVWTLVCRQNVIPKKVTLQDYNWRTPSTPLKVEHEIGAPASFGTFYEYGDHYKDESEGKSLAELRGQELSCRRKVFFGTGDAKAFRAGSRFTLKDHYRPDFNQEYLITEVYHRGSQPVEHATPPDAAPTYENRFVCVPASATFRPERVTHRPRVSGVLTAKVDASGDGQYAEIDEHGRYKVMIPFDLSGKQSGTASRWIRMAQPYAGAGMGFHTPLHKGTEVILIHTNGDPDRPIVAGAVTNPETQSPVTGDNHTQCVLHSGGGNQMVIEDGAGGQRVTWYSPTGKTVFGIGAPPSA